MFVVRVAGAARRLAPEEGYSLSFFAPLLFVHIQLD
jgi:hypothetical protein